MNIRKALTSIVLVIIAVFAAYMGSKYMIDNKAVPESRAKEKAKLFVKAEKVAYTNNKTSVVATGRLAAQNLVDLSAEVSGKLLKGNVSLKEGSEFKKGDLLLRIFDEEAQNNLKAAKSRFLNGIAGILPDMKIDFENNYNKWLNFFNEIDINKELPELPKIESDKEKVFLASRNILNDYYTIESAQVRLSFYKIYAPFNGTFTKVMMEVGSVANPGSRIATMIKTDKLELEVPVKTDDVYWINIGDEVNVSTRDGRMNWMGKVIRKSNYVDPASQSINIFVSVDPVKEKPLYQGQYLQAKFSEKLIAESMKIPRNAIFNKEWVYVLNSSKLKKVKVNILAVNKTTALISGLEKGIFVVVEPLINANEGMEAEILK
jgi:multidrug efflux pump subunit AcrA (membrane-fusion protein)